MTCTGQQKLTVLLSTEALLAFGSGNEVRVADGLVDIELLLFGWRHSLGRRVGQGRAFPLLYQAFKTDDKMALKLICLHESCYITLAP